MVRSVDESGVRLCSLVVTSRDASVVRVWEFPPHQAWQGAKGISREGGAGS